MGADFSAVESRVLAGLAGEDWKLDAYRKYDETGDPQYEPYCVMASQALKRCLCRPVRSGEPLGTYRPLLSVTRHFPNPAPVTVREGAVRYVALATAARGELRR
jgi:hypothetical protein